MISSVIWKWHALTYPALSTELGISTLELREISHKKRKTDGGWAGQNYNKGAAQEIEMASDVVSKGASPQRDLLVDEKYFKSYSFYEVHALMLSDRRRTLTYRLVASVAHSYTLTLYALNAIIEGSEFLYFRLALTQAHKRLHDQIILDVGCGTGILSIFGAKAGASHVFAVDAAKKACELAEKIIAENGLTSSITVINSQVEDVQPAVLDRVGAIVSEWMGYCLLYENMLTSVLLARDKYLLPVPSTGTTDGVGTDDLAAWRRLRLFPCSASLFAAAFTETSPELDGAPGDSAELDDEALESIDDPQKYTRKELWSELSELYQAKLDGVFADHVADEFYHQVHVKVVSKAAIVSNACRLCHLDLSTLDAGELARNGVQGHLDISSIGLVRVNGIAIWFSVEFPDGEVMSTSPDLTPTHWQQCLIYLPQPLNLHQDDRIQGSVTFTHPFSNKRDLDVTLDCRFIEAKTETCILDFKRTYRLQS
ncbi:histone methyltransferase activity (H3-R2 specific) [Sparganum proliferum]